MAPRTYDPTVLMRLVGDDPAAVDDTLRLFVRVGREWRAEVAVAAAAGALGPLQDLGHRMKSSARSIGAEALGARCAALEQAAAGGDLAAALAEAAHAGAAFDAVAAEIGPPAAIQPSSPSTDSGRE